MSRTELGQYKVQGLDYHYTLQGWLKGVNLPGAGDIGADGTATKRTGKDAFAFSLGYYQGDYTPISTTAINQGERDQLWQRYREQTNTAGLYNGNIAWMVTDLSGGTNTPPLGAGGLQGMLYGYDQLNRIRWARSLTNYNPSSGFAARPTGAQAYDSRYSYNANGNLLTQVRHDGAAAVQDDFNYQYYAGTNRLMSVRPDSEVYEDKVFSSGAVPASNKPYANISLQNQAYVATGTNVKLQATGKVTIKSAFSIQGGGSLEIEKAEGGTYKYDAIGNLIRDEQEGTSIIWNVYGKIKQVDKADGSRLTFSYDAAGNRISKTVTKAGRTTTTHYLRDASGNVMAIYQDALLEEQPLYGSSRLGSYKGGRLVGERRLGLKQYELSNHLGNVLATVSDNISLSATETLAKTLSTTDYHPFGLQMEGRTFNFEKTRYGFNGKELDREGMGGGGSTYDYGFRIYNPRIAKFLSVDPLTKDYPWYTPYQFAGNKPIQAIDLDGAEELPYIDKIDYTGSGWDYLNAVENGLRDAINIVPGLWNSGVSNVISLANGTWTKDVSNEFKQIGANIGAAAVKEYNYTVNTPLAEQVSNAFNTVTSPSAVETGTSLFASYYLLPARASNVSIKLSNASTTAAKTTAAQGTESAAEAGNLVRVRHHTGGYQLKGIKRSGTITASRGQPFGVDVEVAPFVKPSKANMGQQNKGAYVEFSIAKDELMTPPPGYMGGTGNAARIVTEGKPLPLKNTNPSYVKWLWW